MLGSEICFRMEMSQKFLSSLRQDYSVIKFELLFGEYSNSMNVSEAVNLNDVMFACVFNDTIAIVCAISLVGLQIN